MEIEMTQLVFAAAFVVFLLLIVGRVLAKPLRIIVKLVFNSIIGLVMLLGFNFVGAYFGLSIPVNIFTIVLAGFLGIPGLILLIVLQFLG